MNSIEIKELRESLGLSRADLALRLGVDQSTVQKWETGVSKISAPKLNKLIELAKTTTRSDDNNGTGHLSNVIVSGGKSIESLVELMAKQQETMAKQQDTINKMLEQQDRLISLLEKKLATT